MDPIEFRVTVIGIRMDTMEFRIATCYPKGEDSVIGRTGSLSEVKNLQLTKIPGWCEDTLKFDNN